MKHGIDTAKPVKELLDDLRVLYKSENDDDDDDDKFGAQAAGPARLVFVYGVIYGKV